MLPHVFNLIFESLFIETFECLKMHPIGSLTIQALQTQIKAKNTKQFTLNITFLHIKIFTNGDTLAPLLKEDTPTMFLIKKFKFSP